MIVDMSGEGSVTQGSGRVHFHPQAVDVAAAGAGVVDLDIDKSPSIVGSIVGPVDGDLAGTLTGSDHTALLDFPDIQVARILRIRNGVDGRGADFGNSRSADGSIRTVLYDDL